MRCWDEDKETRREEKIEEQWKRIWRKYKVLKRHWCKEERKDKEKEVDEREEDRRERKRVSKK